MGYASKAIKGVSWIGILRASTRAVSFLRLAILARLLSPHQFGVFGVAMLVLSLLEVLTETGINIFLIQRREDSNKYINSAWVVSITRGILISVILVILSPFISTFFNSPETQNLIILISIVPFIRGFINPSIINIQKNIQFHKEFYLRLSLFTIDALVAIIAAFITKSAESMIYGLIVSAIIEVIVSFVIFDPKPKFILEIEKIKFIIRRSWWITVNGIFSYFSENSDNIFVGRLLGTADLGIYQNAYKLSTLPISEITESVNKVTFPVYVRLSDDSKRLINAFSKVTGLSILFSILIGIIVYFFAESIVLLMLGEAWLSAVSVIKILAIYGILRTGFGNFGALFLSRGKQNYVAIMTFTRLLALLILIIPLINAYGMIGASYAMLLSILIEIPVILFFVYKFFK